ncbi:hypothetical protein [Agromyces sp. Root81]|nr:hypothetical protein [Agromyces sp. Root81]
MPARDAVDPLAVLEAQDAAEQLGIDWSPSLSVGVNVPDYVIERLAAED